MADLTKTPSIHSAVESKHGHGEIAELAAAHGDSKALDVAAQFLASIDPSIIAEPVSDAEKKKVLRKIDWILVPILSATCILAAVDKVIIANAALYGMKTDTHLVGQEYSWVGSICPSLLLHLQHHRPQLIRGQFTSGIWWQNFRLHT